MKETIAFLLPPATALAGMRMTRLFLGRPFEKMFGFGFRFAVGLAVGMVVFTQTLLLATLLGINSSAILGWTALSWGFVELVILVPKMFVGLKKAESQKTDPWLVLLIPAIVFLWLSARLSVIEGTLEFDAAAFWLTKSRMLYFEQGKHFLALLNTSNMAYTHMDYPWLTSALYTLIYGAIGSVDEFVIKVWPFWMVVALCLAVLSLGRVWNKPHPAPILLVLILCFLPATCEFIRLEGATMPLVFLTSMAALLFMTGFVTTSNLPIAAGILVLGACAATKLEGVIYSSLWGCAIAIFCWRRGWLKNRLIWKSIIIAACFLVPYFLVRLQKHVSYPEAAWLQNGATAPALVLFHRFPQMLFLSIGQRMFHSAFFKWDSPDNTHLHFIGKWQGIHSFASQEFSIIPWLLLILIGLTFWKKRSHRMALATLLAIVLAQVLILSFVISCLSQMQSSVPDLIKFSETIVGRYYYPFFTVCLLGTLAIWFLDQQTSELATVAINSEAKSPQDNLLSCEFRNP